MAEELPPNPNPPPDDDSPEYEIHPLDAYSIDELVEALCHRGEVVVVVVGRQEGETFNFHRTVYGDRWRAYAALKHFTHDIFRTMTGGGEWRNS